MYQLYGDKYFTKQTVHVWCNKMLVGQKFVSHTEEQSFVIGLNSSQHRSLHRAFRNLLTNGTNDWTN